jgi:hypothetical protein
MRQCVLILLAANCCAQTFTQRGFIDTNFTLYPETAPNDRGRALSDSLLRYEPTYKAAPWLRIYGAFDTRFDTHQLVERNARIDYWDRSIRRPAFSIRRLSATINKGPLTLELGKQFIRWGKADILNPTDRFAPRDFLSVVTNDFLAVTAARATVEYPKDTLDLVWQMRFTPSRTPLLNQRWAVFPDVLSNIPITDAGARHPGGSQFGARWNHTGQGYEYSLSFFDGQNHLPLFDGRVVPSPLSVSLQRFYPQMRMYGADAAVPLRWLTVKSETAYFTSTTPQAAEYFQYVVQLERQSGEWSLVGGYSGEYVTPDSPVAGFAPDRGLTRAFLGRAGYTIDTNRSVAVETAVRTNGEGAWVRSEYTQSFGQHWRATAGFTLIHGNAPDFLGQYHRNSHVVLGMRYSF